MDIHFVSSMNPDDEERLASTVIQALRPLLEQLPIAYTMRIQTSSGRVFQHARAEASLPQTDAAPAAYTGPAFGPRSALS